MSETTAEGNWGDAWSEPDDATDVEPGTGDEDVVDAEFEDEDGPDAGSDDDIVDAELEPEDVGWARGGWGQSGSGTADDPIVVGTRSAPSDRNAVQPYRVTDDPSAWGWGRPAPVEPEPAKPREDHTTLPKSEVGTAGSGKGAAKGKVSNNPLKLLRPPRSKVTGSRGGGGGVHVHLVTVNPTLKVGGGSRTTTVGGVVIPPRRSSR